MVSSTEDMIMLLKRKVNISVFTALAAALLLLAADVFAGQHGEKQAGIADTSVSTGSFNTLETVTAAKGSDVAVRVLDEALFINDSRAVATDIGASKGVIHVVDAVILPN